MNQEITYRGAKAQEEEVCHPHQEAHKETQNVEYRGAKGEATIGHDHKVQHVTYRGAEADMDI
ncbi:MAG: hypothetical protein CMO55_28140 [Verrucomicrobiales bacterium]|nr:hypothetical protein [Verrucomicrobiales bacterium]